jgi:hypothetical protein
LGWLAVLNEDGNELIFGFDGVRIYSQIGNQVAASVILEKIWTLRLLFRFSASWPDY